MNSFEDLWIWQEARSLVKEVYEDFRDGLPGSNDWGFRNQIQRAVVSVMNNIAEGFERTTDAEFARFLEVAKGSCGEVRSMYYPAEDLRYVLPEKAQSRRNKARKLASGIHSLAIHLRAATEKEKESKGRRVKERTKSSNSRNARNARGGGS